MSDDRSLIRQLADLLRGAGAKVCFCLDCRHQQSFGPCTKCGCTNSPSKVRSRRAPMTDQDQMRERAEAWYRTRFNYADHVTWEPERFDSFVAFAQQEVERALRGNLQELADVMALEALQAAEQRAEATEAQIRGTGYVPYLDRMAELVKRAEEAERMAEMWKNEKQQTDAALSAERAKVEKLKRIGCSCDLMNGYVCLLHEV